MKAMNPTQLGESVIGGQESFEDFGCVDSTTRKMTDMFLYRSGGSTGGSYENPVDRAFRLRSEQDKRFDPEGHERRRREAIELHKDTLDGWEADRRFREQLDWENRGKPVVGPLKVTPTPETRRDRNMREEMAKEGYVASGRNPKTGKLEFKRAEENPWFLGMLGGSYEMVGTVMHNISYSRGLVGATQRLENAVGSLIIGEVRDGNPKLKAVYDKLKSGTGGKYDGLHILEIMGNVPALKDTAYALWVGHMRGLESFQQNLMEDGVGTALLDRFIEEHGASSLGSGDDFADTLISILSTISQESRFGAVLSMKSTDAKKVIQESLETRVLKISRELKESLSFIGIDDNFFEDTPYVKCSSVPNRVLDGFSELIAQTTYERLAEKLKS